MKKKIKILMVSDVSRATGYCEEVIRRDMRSGKLKSVKIKEKYYVSKNCVDVWLKRKQERIPREVLERARKELS